MSMRPNKIEPDDLDLLLKEAEGGVAGNLLRAVSEEIEPRLEFAQGLESRLLAGGGSSHAQPTQSTSQRHDVPIGITGRLNAASGDEGMRKRSRIAPIAFGTLGVAAMILLFVGMAAMLNLRQQKSGTPQPVDSSEAVKHFQLLHTLSLYFSSPPTQDMEIAWSPNGKVIAAAVESGVSFWDGETGQFLYTVPANKIVNMAFSPDGSSLALGVQGGERDGNGIQLVDPATGQKGHYLRYSTKGTMVSESDVTRIAWSPDSKLLATTAQEVTSYPPSDGLPRSSTTLVVGIIQVWDVSTGNELQALRIPGESMGVRSISAIAWSPIGTTIASTSIGGALRLWDATTGKMHYHLATNRMYEFALMEWSPKGGTLAIVAGREVHLWDAQSGKMLRVLPEGLPTFPTPAPTTNILPGAIPTIPVPTVTPGAGRSPVVEADYYNILGLSWSPDGHTLAIVDGGHIRLWDPATGELKLTLDGGAYQLDLFWLAWSPDGQVFAASGWQEVELRDSLSGELIHRLPYREARHMAWSPDGQLLALSSGVATQEGATSIEIAIWGAQQGPEPVKRTTIPTAPATEAVSSPAPTLVEPIAGYATPSVGSPMPDFESVDVRTGQPITISSLRGKPLVLTFWGAWCPPCKVQLPALQKAFDTYGTEINFVSVSTMGRGDTPDSVKEFITQNGYKWLFTHAEIRSLVDDFVTAVPITYFIDKDGIVRAVHLGQTGFDDSLIERYVNLLNTGGSVASPTPYLLIGTATSPAYPGPYATPVVGAIIPDFESIDVRTGQKFTVLSLRGKPLVLTVWNTSCLPCIEELPTLRKADYSYGKDVQFLNVSVNGTSGPQDTPDSVKEFITNNGYPWRFSHTDTALTALNLVAILPTTFFIDSDGIVRAVHVGGTGMDIPKYLDLLGITVSPTEEPTATNGVATSQAVPTCGPTWNAVPSRSEGTLYSVVAISSADVWAVGYTAGLLGKTMVQHWDGKDWSIIPSPNLGTEDNRLYGVAALAANDVWAVGYYSQDSRNKTLTMHWDGNDWKIVPSPNVGESSSGGASDSELHALVAISSNDVWAVGLHAHCDASPCPAQTLTLHWDGKVWEIAPSPSPGAGNNSLQEVAAISSNDIWAVGNYEDAAVSRPLFLHWDGKAWDHVQIDATATSMAGIAAISKDDVWAIGSSYSVERGNEPQGFHWDGTMWAKVSIPLTSPSPFNPPAQDYPSGIVALSANDVWVIGSYIAPSDQSSPHTFTTPLLVHWNGREWTHIPNPLLRTVTDADGQIEYDNRPIAIAAAPGGDLWAVGTSSDADERGIVKTLIMRYTTAPCATPTPGP